MMGTPSLAAAFAAAVAHGANPQGPHSFDGQWSLEFRVDTKPGGESFTTRQGIVVSPMHFQFHSAKDLFQFRDDRQVKLEDRDRARLAVNLVGHHPAGFTLTDRGQWRGLLRVEGSGSGDGPDRKVQLVLSWTAVEGIQFTTESQTGTSQTTRLRASEDATSLTLTNEAGTVTLPNTTIWTSQWELSATSIERSETGPGVIMETATYRDRRQTRLFPLDPSPEPFSPPLPVVEEIELKQVRHLKLVPRG